MKVNPASFYKNIYAITENITPLLYDCGTLCGKICCTNTDSGEGMYLYPYEEVMYESIPPWAQISKSDFVVNKRKTLFFTCNGSCERTLRPLACRIFPLVPYLDGNGEIYTILDPRSIGLCPLAEKSVSDEFKKKVHTVSLMLNKIPMIKQFLQKQSKIIDEYIEINNIFFNNRRELK